MFCYREPLEPLFKLQYRLRNLLQKTLHVKGMDTVDMVHKEDMVDTKKYYKILHEK